MPLLDDYTNNNIATQIAVLKERPPKPPNMTVCIPYYSNALIKIAEWTLIASENRSSDCVECEGLRNNSWNVWDRMEFATTNESSLRVIVRANMIANSLVQKMLEEGQEFGTLILNESNFNWNQPITDAVMKLMNCIRIQDNTFLHDFDSHFFYDTMCVGANLTLLRQLSKDLIERLDQLIRDAVELYLKAYIATDRDLKFVLENYPLSGRSRFVASANAICFPLLENSTGERFILAAFDDPYDPPWLRTERTFPFRVWPDDTIIYASAYLYDALYQTDQADWGKVNREIVGLSYAIDARVIEGRPGIKCDRSEHSITYCIVERQVRVAMAQCGCIPVFYRFIDDQSDLPFCDQDAYEECTDILQDTLKDHQQECSAKCKYTFYKWKQFATTVAIDMRHMVFEVSMSPSQTALHVEFTLTIKSTWEQFLSQIGGLVNLFLGISGLSVCAFLAFCLELAKKWRQSKKNGDLPAEAETRKHGHRFSNFGIADSELTETVRRDIERILEKRLTQIESSLDAKIGTMDKTKHATLKERGRMESLF